jgi:hypothetical protein
MVNSRPAATYFKRVEQKYILSPAQYRSVLGFLDDFAQEDEYGLSTVYSIYYDSDTFALTRNCLNPAVFKEKLRLRSYDTLTQGGVIYWELKKKFRGITYKQRFPAVFDMAGAYTDINSISGDQTYTYHEIKWLAKTYRPRPQFLICYERRAFRGLGRDDFRVTFDTHIHWRNRGLDFAQGFYGKPLCDENYYIMELKICGAVPLEFNHQLTGLKIFPVAFSKYKLTYLQYLAGGKEHIHV